MKSPYFLAFFAALGCALPPSAKTAESAPTLLVHAVEWNPTRADVGAARLVADLGGDVVVFGDGAATVMSDGVVTNVDHAVRKWTSAGTIPATDGTGLWIAGTDDAGDVYRLRARRAFERVSDRFGLRGGARGMVGFGGKYVGFDLGTAGLLLSDGAVVMRLAATPGDELAGGGTLLARLTRDGAWTMDAKTRATRSYAVAGAKLVAVDDRGSLYVATDRAIYAEAPDGSLSLRYVGHDVRGLVASHDRVWFADDGELGTISESGASRTRGGKLAADARLLPSSSGDVWAVDSKGAVARFSIGAASPASGRVRWQDAAFPVYSRVCAGCHAAGGTSGIDLSSERAWVSKRDLVRQRVLVDRDMPPATRPVTDADRAQIQRWLDAPAR